MGIGKDRCKGSDFKVTCQPSQICSVKCHGTSACQDAKIDANGATDTSLECGGGDDVCSGSTSFICGSGHCSVHCDMSSDDSCKDIYVNTQNAQSFECTGNCPKYLSPFSENPITPTLPRTNPTIYTPTPSISNLLPTKPTLFYTVPTKKQDIILSQQSDSEHSLLWLIVGVIIFVVFVVLFFMVLMIWKRQKLNKKRSKWRANKVIERVQGDGHSADRIELQYEGRKNNNADPKLSMNRSITISEQHILNNDDATSSSNSSPIPPPPDGPPPTNKIIAAHIALPNASYKEINDECLENETKGMDGENELMHTVEGNAAKAMLSADD